MHLQLIHQQFVELVYLSTPNLWGCDTRSYSVLYVMFFAKLFFFLFVQFLIYAAVASNSFPLRLFAYIWPLLIPLEVIYKKCLGTRSLRLITPMVSANFPNPLKNISICILLTETSVRFTYCKMCVSDAVTTIIKISII